MKLVNTLLILLLGIVMLQADDIGDLSRQVIEKWQNSVITVKLITEMYESERKIEVLATVIDDAGLAIISLSSFGSGMGLDNQVKIKDLKMVMPDNTEIPAKILLRDQDFDIAFIRPTEKTKQDFFPVDLKNSHVPEIMELYVALSRLSSAAGYVVAGAEGRVLAIIKKPRLYYVPDFITVISTGLATPAFSIDGNLIGIIMLKTSRSGEYLTDEMFRGMGGMSTLPVIVPAKDIIDILERAPELKKP